MEQLTGHTVVAIDGTKFFGSNKKSCPECLRNKAHCFHSGAVMSIVGDVAKLVIVAKARLLNVV